MAHCFDKLWRYAYGPVFTYGFIFVVKLQLEIWLNISFCLPRRMSAKLDYFGVVVIVKINKYVSYLHMTCSCYDFFTAVQLSCEGCRCNASVFSGAPPYIRRLTLAQQCLSKVDGLLYWHDINSLWQLFSDNEKMLLFVSLRILCLLVVFVDEARL